MKVHRRNVPSDGQQKMKVHRRNVPADGLVHQIEGSKPIDLVILSIVIEAMVHVKRIVRHIRDFQVGLEEAIVDLSGVFFFS